MLAVSLSPFQHDGEALTHADADRHDGDAASDTAPVPVVEAPGSASTAEVHGSTAAPAADEADRTP